MESENELPPPPSIGRLLNFAAGATTRMCQAWLAAHDLSLAQWVVLSTLMRRDGLPVTEIARMSGNALPAASRILDRMEERGLVERRRDPRDRRGVRVHLTEAGRAHEGLREFHLDVNAALLEGFTEAERAALFELLERLLANAEKHAPRPL